MPLRPQGLSRSIQTTSYLSSLQHLRHLDHLSQASGQASSIWTSETPRTVRQVAQQEQLIKEAIQRALQSPTEAISKLAKACSQNLVPTTLNQRQIAELQSTIQQLNKKKRRTKAKVQVETGMAVEDVQERSAFKQSF